MLCRVRTVLVLLALLVPVSCSAPVEDTDVLDCDVIGMSAEPSAVGFPSKLAAAQAAADFAGWGEVTLHEIRDTEWVGFVDGRTVVRMSTFPNPDGTWEWGNLAQC